MAGENRTGRAMNPGFLHLQKLALELKCPLCLNFLKKPHLLPCDHIFCRSCLPKSKHLGLECPYCKGPYADEDSRHLPFIENLVSIYRGLDAAFHVTAMQSVGSGAPQVLGSNDESLKASFNHSIHVRNCSFSPMSKKSNPVPSTPVGIAAGEKGMSDKCSLPRGLKDNDKNVVEDGGRKAKPNAQSPLIDSQTGTQSMEEYVTTTLVDQLSLDSPSFGDLKYSEDDSNDQCGNDTPQNHAMALVKQNSVDNQRCGGHDSSASGTSEEHLRNSKRQKLNYSSKDTGLHIAGPFEARDSQAEKLAISGVHNHAASNKLPANGTVCGFCQSSSLSEDTGPMLHYLDGNLVEGHEATMSTALHVHRICVEWAPQVFFVGDTINNLKEELARGAKLKCSKCGQKGAALGCYVQSCRKSYHVPCAMEIARCRWDFEDYLLLCPGHSSHKFPAEKSKRVKQKLKDNQNTRDDLELAKTVLKQSNPWIGSKKWLFCGSALSAEEKLSRTLPFLSMALSLLVSLQGPKLFQQLNFYLSGDFVSGYRKDLQNLIVAAGGTAWGSKEDLLEMSKQQKGGDGASPTTLVVYNLDPPPGCKLGEEVSILWERLNEAEDIAAKTGSQVIGHTWLLESIAACKLQPLVS
ncbi:unnamed protein product [Linum tenue]|uniref:Uncharacterized protein n=1 Tax=Linum tenue TaxID=586396 RepID=A0AAV0HL14_9ROSI|nr:unnamed protein product [Linum tenue]